MVSSEASGRASARRGTDCVLPPLPRCRLVRYGVRPQRVSGYGRLTTTYSDTRAVYASNKSLYRAEMESCIRIMSK